MLSYALEGEERVVSLPLATRGIFRRGDVSKEWWRALEAIFPAHVVDAILSNEAIRPEAYRDVVVLFADSLSEAQSLPGSPRAISRGSRNSGFVMKVF